MFLALDWARFDVDQKFVGDVQSKIYGL